MALAKAAAAMRGRGAEAGSSQQKVRALRGIYRTPWQLALQVWLEGVAPANGRLRAPRAAEATARCRDARTQALFLDDECRPRYERLDERRIPLALGAIADFCDVRVSTKFDLSSVTRS